MSVDMIDLFLRLLAAVVFGALIGIEREIRQKSAGIRTHIVVALASALMMIVSKYGFADVLSVEGISVDASRIAAGVVSAIGFLGAGVIFVRNDSSSMGLTTAAGLWATVGVGIAAGAGMYAIADLATLIMLLVQFVLHMRFIRAIWPVSGAVRVDTTATGLSPEDIKGRLASEGISFSSYSLRKGGNGHVMFSAYIAFSSRKDHGKAIQYLENSDYISDFEIHSFI